MWYIFEFRTLQIPVERYVLHLCVCDRVCCFFFVDLELTEEEFEDTKGAIRIRISKTTQWPKEKEQKDKQRSTKHTYKTKDRVTRPH